MGLPKINVDVEPALTVASDERLYHNDELEKNIQVQHELEISSVSYDRKESKPKYLPEVLLQLPQTLPVHFSYVWPLKRRLRDVSLTL
jgi:hypothetical protein